MTIRAFNYQASEQAYSGQPVWLFPSLYVLTCWAVAAFLGVFDEFIVTDLRMQRDINAAIGLPLLTGYFWLSVRLVHKRLAGTLLKFLLKKRALSNFSRHRLYLNGRLNQHIIQCALISVALTTLYIVSENLLSAGMPLHVLFLDIVAYPFWFCFWLFLFQSVASTRYVNRRFIFVKSAQVSDLKDLKAFSDLGLGNTRHALTGVALLPVFWLNCPIPALDILILSLFVGVLTTYLIVPVIRVHRLIKQEKRARLHSIDRQMMTLTQNVTDRTDALRSMENLENERETIQAVRVWPVAVRQIVSLAVSVGIIPLSWLFLLIINNING